ncbi:MAG: serine/threonine-protein kinase [Verrucomicrobiales bacterium]
MAHLDGCSSCQRVLDKLAGGEEISNEWKPILQSVSNRCVPASSLSDLVNHLKRHPAQAESPRVTETDLTFLRPSDVENSLGKMGLYEVVGLIAQGGMGIVLRAIDPDLQREVAIKVLSPVLAVNEGARARFLREARAVASLDHPNILPVYGVGDEDSLPYLVMPLVKGESLQERLGRCGALPITDTLAIGAKLALGLEAAHASGIVHRDIKPANVLLDGDGERVWITDFGLARAAEDSAISRTGSIAGTPQYMAPEQFRTSDVDARADLFSLGGVFYAMATGHAPFDGDSAVTAMRSVCNDVPARPDRINVSVPGWFADLVMALLEKQPDNRPSSAGQVAELIAGGALKSEPNYDQKTKPTWKVPIAFAATIAALSMVFIIADLVSIEGVSQQNAPFRLNDNKSFKTLAAAVAEAANGDTIAIAGDNTFQLRETLRISGKALRLVAGTGGSSGKTTMTVGGSFPAISTDSKLVIEGLEIQRVAGDGRGSLIFSNSDLFLLNCRLVSVPVASGGRELDAPGYRLVELSGPGKFEAWNCEFYSPAASALFVSDLSGDEQRILNCRNCASLVVDCIRITEGGGQVIWNADRSFFGGRTGVIATTTGRPVCLKAKIDHCVLGFKGAVIGVAGMTREEFRKTSSWAGDANLYANCQSFLKVRMNPQVRRFRAGVDTLTDWVDFWGREESRASYVTVRLRDRLPIEQIPTSIDEIQASVHLQLPPEVVEKAVDTKLGPDLSLLGQGEVFGAFRASEAYQEWLQTFDQ